MCIRDRLGIVFLKPSNQHNSPAVANNVLMTEKEEIAQYIEDNIEDFEDVLLDAGKDIMEDEFLEELLESVELDELF